jgi:signal transduction histidine kinase
MMFSILLVIISVFFTMMVFGQQLAGKDPSFGANIVPFLGFLLGLALAVFLVWRKRFPYLVAAIAAVLPIILPTTNLPAAIAIGVLLQGRRGPWVWVILGATYLATILTVVRDVGATTSFFALFTGSRDADGAALQPHLIWFAPLVAAVVLVPFIAVGIVRRTRAERDDARDHSLATEQSAVALHGEVERDRERREVAREIHDTLASRLSALSLHAGALELSVDSSDATSHAARVVRESAQSSLDDLRHVIEVLRSPHTHTVERGNTGLGDIADLVEDAHALHDRVRSQIVISDPAGCDPSVAHAAYRIVQESLSNARRHAPGSDVLLDLRGGPGIGVTVHVSNPLPTAPPSATTGGGHGTVGMAERAQLLGGSFSAGPTADGQFAVVAWLPWVTPVG